MFENANTRVKRAGGLGAEDRRRNARYPFTASVEAVEAASKTRIQGRTSDLSRGGCYVDTISSFPAGSIVKMRLTKERQSFETQAEVVYSLVDMGMGLKFTDVDPEQFRIVDKWVGELSGELKPEQETPGSLEQASSQGKPGNSDIDVLKELLLELMGQGVLSKAKCEGMLKRLNCVRGANSGLGQA